MTAATADLPLRKRHVGDRNFPMAANTCCWENTMVAVSVPGGLAHSAPFAATDKILGAARKRYDNRNGLANAISAEIESDWVRPYFNSAGGDAITLGDIGKDCYAVDDQTLALTDGGGTRPRAGKIHNVTELGVWLRFDQ